MTWILGIALAWVVWRWWRARQALLDARIAQWAAEAREAALRRQIDDDADQLEQRRQL